MEDCNSGIYQIKNILNGKIYIGSTINFTNRKRNHFNDLKKNKHCNQYLQNAWNKYGDNNFVFEIIEYVTDKETLLDREQFYLDKFKCYEHQFGYNIQKTARIKFGYKQSEETKGKISNVVKGRKHTKEAREKISQALRQRKRKPETFEKIANKLRGQKRNEEQRKRISEAHIGIKQSEEQKQKRRDKMLGTQTGSDNFSAKIDEDQVRDIKLLIVDGRLKQCQIAKLYDVSRTTIKLIGQNKTWTHVSITDDDVLSMELEQQIMAIINSYNVKMGPTPKLSINDIDNIKNIINEKSMKQYEIAELYNVSLKTINNISREMKRNSKIAS